jgi:hypothetical protein
LSVVAGEWNKAQSILRQREATGPNESAVDPADIVDGEAVLRQALATAGSTAKPEPMVIDESVEDTVEQKRQLLCSHLNSIAALLLAGIEGWTVDARVRYLEGTQVFVSIVQGSAVDLLPQLFHGLGQVIRHEEGTVREAAQSVCTLLGEYVPVEELWDLLLPRARGQVPGGDTASQSNEMHPHDSSSFC